MNRAPKTRANLSIERNLVRRAKALHINLSETLEAALAHSVRAAERKTWLDQNREAIDGYNANVAKRGVFSDRWRRF
jgi:antitoxin CcdA